MANPPHARIGKRIRALRQARGWSQEELAHRSGLHPTYVGGIERGQRNFRIGILYRLARALCEHPCALLPNNNANHRKRR